MSTRSRGKRLATGITAAVGVGSFAAAGVAAAAVYAATPSVIARTRSATDSRQDSSPQGNSAEGNTEDSKAKSGSARSGDDDDHGSRHDKTTRRSKSYSNSGGTSPVQPGNGSTIHGRSSGS
ncbi:hypothetical protein [Arthrobacter sp. SLBN-122]|uniref:hypothetical protein n=1 Tax=Arthrobacter sp. SLBN-122 TaxID=2768455 RepID=UPI00114FB14C|nr:hypothetical protein [Arthrobacter sp. SLBN-122]TQJ35939.1 hypothetical protein FBY36_3219 [Arthrobacter sp. SLBN-122]